MQTRRRMSELLAEKWLRHPRKTRGERMSRGSVRAADLRRPQAPARCGSAAMLDSAPLARRCEQVSQSSSAWRRCLRRRSQGRRPGANGRQCSTDAHRCLQLPNPGTRATAWLRQPWQRRRLDDPASGESRHRSAAAAAAARQDDRQRGLQQRERRAGQRRLSVADCAAVVSASAGPLANLQQARACRRRCCGCLGSESWCTSSRRPQPQRCGPGHAAPGCSARCGCARSD